MYTIGSIVQFGAAHKWHGCVGVVENVKEDENESEVKYIVAVPIPDKRPRYIFITDDAPDVEYVGEAVLLPTDEYEKSPENTGANI